MIQQLSQKLGEASTQMREELEKKPGCTMFELQAVRSLEALATEAKNKIVNPIQPEFNPAENGEVLIAFPGDPLHPSGAAKPTDKHRLLAQMDGVHMIMRLEKNIGIPSIIAGKL